jgi:hypothetical protein
MKIRTILLTLIVVFASAVAALAQNLHMGTWKLNEAKSKIAKGSAKNQTVVYEMSGDMIKVTVNGTDADGDPVNNEWTGKFDGNYYAVTGSTNSDTRMRSYRRINSRSLAIREKAGARVGRNPKTGEVVRIPAKVVVTGMITVASDGKSRTVVTNTADAKGKRLHNVAVYDKQ